MAFNANQGGQPREIQGATADEGMYPGGPPILDSTPSNVLELGSELCAWGHVSMDAFHHTLERVKAVERE